MARTIAYAHEFALAHDPFAILRSAIVLGCALALILAKQALPAFF